MPKDLEAKTIRRSAGEVPTSTAADLEALLAIPEEAIDTTDIPERTGDRRRLRRDVDGRLPKGRSVIRDTVNAAMDARQMSVYALCKAAKVYAPTISETAIGEFLKGQRSIGIEFLEAIMQALGMVISFVDLRARDDFMGESKPIATAMERVTSTEARSGTHG